MASNLILLGVFGHSNQISQDDLYTHVLTPLLEELQVLPDRILLPTEGNTSIYIQDWADTLRVQTQSFYSDWQRNGRIAQILRDDGMQKECTHALVFLSSRSERMEKFAEKMAKKGKRVFTSSPQIPIQLNELCVERLPRRRLQCPLAKQVKEQCNRG
jgi:hypothetical protein